MKAPLLVNHDPSNPLGFIQPDGTIGKRHRCHFRYVMEAPGGWSMYRCACHLWAVLPSCKYKAS